MSQSPRKEQQEEQKSINVTEVTEPAPLVKESAITEELQEPIPIKIEEVLRHQVKLNKSLEKKYWAPKLVLNIRKEKDFRTYSEIARKIIIDQKQPCITLTSCGIAILNLLKVSSVLGEHIPGLHKVSRFILSKCKTCEYRSSKGLNDVPYPSQ